MRPIEKTAEDLFQKLRARFSPITLGNEDSESTSEPSQARFFNMIYKEEDRQVGPVSIGLVDGRSMKVFFGQQLIDAVENKPAWYNFLKELREFAKRNMLTFDARDIAKDQLDSRDFNWLGKVDGTMDEKDINISESTMWGSKRRSYQALESVKIIVQHSKSVDESVPGARSRSIHGIYLERSDGERYKFPYNYLTGARAMARHISEGGNPYDDLGKHILETIKEMRDLSKFARMTRSHAMEDADASSIRNKIVERYQGLKATLGALSHPSGYRTYAENYQPSPEHAEGKFDEIKEVFTRKIWDQKMEELLPAVGRALASAQLSEAPSSVEKMIRDPNRLIVLKKDDAADQMLRKAKFTDATGLMGFILSDIASRAIGDDMDPLANFASDVADRLNDRELDPKDKQLGMLLAKRYMDDIKKMASDPSYADMVRKDPGDIYGKKKKREGGFHEAEAYEAWANDVAKVDEDEHDWAMDWMESGVARSIFRRISMQHPDLLSKYGLDKVMDAVQDQVEFVGDVEEIGSSDVSAWVNQVERSLSVDEASALGEGEQKDMMDAYADAMDPMGGDEDEADELLNQIRQQYGDEAAANAEKHAYATHYGRGHAPGSDALDGGMRKYLDKSTTKSGMIPKGTQAAMYRAAQNRTMSAPAGRLPEATTTGTTGTAGTTGTVTDPKAKAAMAQAAKNVARVATAAGIKSAPNIIAQTMAAQQAGKMPSRQGQQTMGGLGNTIMQAAASDPKKAAALTAMMKKMVTQGKFDEVAVRELLNNRDEIVTEKQLSVKNDQDGDGDSDFADVMIARRVKSGEPKDKAIAATKDKPYNEADINEDKLMAESLQLLKVLAGL